MPPLPVNTAWNWSSTTAPDGTTTTTHNESSWPRGGSPEDGQSTSRVIVTPPSNSPRPPRPLLHQNDDDNDNNGASTKSSAAPATSAPTSSSTAPSSSTPSNGTVSTSDHTLMDTASVEALPASGAMKGLVVASMVGGVFLIAAIAFGLIAYVRRRKRRMVAEMASLPPHPASRGIGAGEHLGGYVPGTERVYLTSPPLEPPQPAYNYLHIRPRSNSQGTARSQQQTFAPASLPIRDSALRVTNR